MSSAVAPVPSPVMGSGPRAAVAAVTRRAPALLGGLAGDAEPGADLGPGVAEAAQAGDGLGDGGVDLGGQAEHEGQGLDVAVGDAAGVGAQDAAGERGVLVVLDQPRGAVWCQRGLDSVRAAGRPGVSWCGARSGRVRRSCGGPVAAAGPRRRPGT